MNMEIRVIGDFKSRNELGKAFNDAWETLTRDIPKDDNFWAI